MSHEQISPEQYVYVRKLLLADCGLSDVRNDHGAALALLSRKLRAWLGEEKPLKMAIVARDMVAWQRQIEAYVDYLCDNAMLPCGASDGAERCATPAALCARHRTEDRVVSQPAPEGR